MRLHIIDTTLRDGEQTPGVDFNCDTKVKIASALTDLGVDVIEVGIPAMGDEEIEAIRKVSQLDLKSELLTWNRLHFDDIEASLKTGVKNIHISVPASFIQIEKKLRKTPEHIILDISRIIEYAIKKGCRVSVGAEDASRADEDFLINLYKVAIEAGATRLRYADTLGVLSPFQTIEIIRKLKEELNTEIDYHGHNDFGMATANALAAYKGGSNYISCSINGLGERAGNTPLEEIVMSLLYMEKCKTNIQTNKLVAISKLVEFYSGRFQSLGKPIVGEGVFSHESGIHVDGLLKDKSNYQYLDPTLLGRTNQFVLGKHSGKSAYKTLKM
ncbi:homoaconitate hydratase [Alkalibaculum sp. M08DMB]|uniref:Homoaconitate hydratase n=1 Tax=Alkalibaculum sporogenes TaxID=2655001 RepID=A0A6A7KCG6_9FIRM|nr:homoaconitate hydratase [Alkalibaculum sporogenes]MPW27042.1 homoaconitate hydratase [Alkalibaculum sporogenes]